LSKNQQQQTVREDCLTDYISISETSGPISKMAAITKNGKLLE
jgi:hypothetical protein